MFRLRVSTKPALLRSRKGHFDVSYFCYSKQKRQFPPLSISRLEVNDATSSGVLVPLSVIMMPAISMVALTSGIIVFPRG